MDTKEPELMQKSIEIDMELDPGKELSEQELLPGAYCQEYEIFKVIYRFMARRLRRTKEDCYIILDSDGRKGELPCLKNQNGQMELLRELIQYSIRLWRCIYGNTAVASSDYGDGFIRPEADMVANRITDAFLPEACGGCGPGALCTILSLKSRRNNGSH